MTEKTKFGIASVVLSAGLSAVAAAAPLAPGVTSLAVAEVNPTGGTVSAALPATFATANYTGTLLTRVISGDTSNPLGGLTFTYQLINDVDSANALTRLTIQGFTGYNTDASYQLGTGTVIPTTNDRGASGDFVGFTFLGSPVGLGTIAAGTSSELLVIQTNATSFVTRQANISNGAVSQVTSFGPAGAITPEPATLLAAAGGTLLLGRRRRA